MTFLSLGEFRLMSRTTWLLTATIIVLTLFATLTGTALADDPEPEPEPGIVSPRIVGGSTAQVGAWPWQVAFLFNGVSPSSGQFCAGSLITDEWVVTAAHCVAVTSSIDIQAGIHSLASNAGQRRDVVSTIVHPSYDPAQNFNNDIALMKLSSPVTLNSTVSTIVPLIAEDGALAAPGVTATVTGWGTTSSGGASSDALLQVDVPIVSTTDCNASTSYNGAITANMLCAGLIEDGGKDSCQGDSGGPLVVPEGTGYRLAGIVSWGIGCALQRLPGVYTRVTEMRDFINQHTGVFTADISLSKTVSPATVQPEQELTYTITVSNLSPQTATGVTVTDVLPVGLTFVSATTTQGVCSGAQTVTCNIGGLSGNSSASLTVKAVVAGTFSGSITNTANAATTASETKTQNNLDSASASVIPKADLAITKTVSTATVPAGGVLTYTLTVSNLGPSASTESVVTDILPSGLTLIASSTVGASCAGEPVVTCAFGSIAPGAQEIVTLTAQVANADLGTIANTAVISTSTPQDLTSTNNSASATTTALTSDVTVSQTASVGTLVAGNEVSYIINISNIGTATATGVTLSDMLPSGLTLLSASATQGTCDDSVGCSLGDITVAGVVQVNILANVPLSVSGQIVNTATASSTSFDHSTGNNQASATVTVTPAPADLEIFKTAPTGPLIAGSEITYTIKVTNNGPATSTDTSVTDNLPVGVSLISAIPTQGGCSGDLTVTCVLGQLSTGEMAEVSVRVRTATSATGQLVNVATASSTAPDNVLGNNSALAVTQIPSVGVWGMAALSALLGLSILWKINSRRRRLPSQL